MMTPTGQVDLYVYYRVRDEDADALLPQVRALQAELAAAHRVVPQLKRRPESADGVQTWMEIYPGVAADSADAMTHAMAEAVALSGLPPLLVGPRHIEVFTDIPCA
ncbi:uncharacterized protein DUF4936 [Pseudoduganella lurida]|uniref:Uncharacterized protein DUF4936 n=1 Tax=Pseudoduganella lurida TaxID=1036180 RepID=A0A562RJB7_9BURK|nr:DUF4936 family protein [Pseudoduganella lurida]TWI69167.1 uncharacterized protein DUF4936 [Pseudoduganella lurida]